MLFGFGCLCCLRCYFSVLCGLGFSRLAVMIWFATCLCWVRLRCGLLLLPPVGLLFVAIWRVGWLLVVFGFCGCAVVVCLRGCAFGVY